ncbi:MAG: hypothetical protein GY793_11470 [Proteobacteria bacterium]|nr:hypothetical protein [Pseudomonadota bacterium]
MDLQDFNIYKSMTLLLLFMISFLLIIYFIFIRSYILSWGATKDEINMHLIGDNEKIPHSSTRAITINKSSNEVWKWLVQIGPDRGGFYSYTFLEKILGYKDSNIDRIIPEYQSMSVDRIVPRTENKSWDVTDVDPGFAFVLKDWGAFVLIPVDKETTRLIIRSHGRDTNNFFEKIKYKILEACHFIMERRMMIGIKDQAEAGGGVKIPSKSDYIWFFGIIITFLSIIGFIFSNQTLQGIFAALIFSIVWLLSLFFIIPQPFFVATLFILIVFTYFIVT